MAVIPSDDKDGTGVRGTGDTLRQERVRRGLTVEQAAQEAGLPRLVVQGLEQGALAPNDVKTSAYLRMYARSLGLDAEARVRDLTGEELVAGDDALTEWTGDAPWGGRAPAGALPGVRAPAIRLVVLFVLAALAAAGITAGVLTANDDAAVDLVAPDPDADADAGDDETDTDTDTEPAPSPSPSPEPEPEPTPEPEPEPAGRAPEDTRVQVLHAPAQASVVDDVVATLEAMGYEVALVSIARTAFPSTTVLYSEGWEAEAEALADRDERFARVAANATFSEELDLHVGVGPEWTAPDEEQE